MGLMYFLCVYGYLLRQYVFLSANAKPAAGLAINFMANQIM